MRTYFLLFLLLSTLFFTAGSYALSQAQTQNQNNYFLEIQGIAWNRATLSILIITPINESWWNPIYVNSALRAVGQWNNAISYFATNYSDFSYIVNLNLLPTVSNKSEIGFDIYLNWTQTPLSNTSNEIGLETSTSLDNAIIDCNISLAVHTSHGDALTDGDMQNIALHELGHSLGLGHCNNSADVMYPDYTLLSSPKLISTLDVYGVATTFAWMSYLNNFYPVNQWLQNTPVTLPLNIPYKNLPVSPQNAIPQTLANNPIVETLALMFEILVHPEILAIVLVFVAVLIILAVIPNKRKGRQEPKPDS